MDERKNIFQNKKLLILIPVLALVALVVGVTYAFFNYTRTGASNTISTGSIYFNSVQTGSIEVTNFFPTDSNSATHGNNSSSMTVTITAGTSYEYGIDYSLTAVNVTRPTGTTTNIPVSVIATTSDAAIGFTPAAEHTITDTENFSLGTGHINQTNSGNSETNGGLEANRVSGVITVTAYINAANVAITDTPEESTPWQGTRQVVNTTEWNRLAETPVTFQVRVVAEEQPLPVTINYNANGGTIATASKQIAGNATTYGDLATPAAVGEYVFGGWYTQAEGGTKVTSTTSFTNGTSATTLYAHWNTPICKRVTNAANLNTETCNQTSNYCAADGYTEANNTITYGNAKELGSSLATGDAFDCKVSTTGGYDERFYYVSPYYNTTTTTFDDLDNIDSYVTLIYYKNFVSGEPSYGGAKYDSSDNWHGPRTAVTHLPTSGTNGTWSNITLKTASRAILAEDGSTHNATSTSGGTLPTTFSYEGKAARLLTAQELMRGCGLTQVGTFTTGELSNCKFLFEGTKYANTDTTTYPTNGPWLETPNASYSGTVWHALASNRYVNGNYAYFASYGVRPAIDVPISAILK